MLEYKLVLISPYYIIKKKYIYISHWKNKESFNYVVVEEFRKNGKGIRKSEFFTLTLYFLNINDNALLQTVTF